MVLPKMVFTEEDEIDTGDFLPNAVQMLQDKTNLPFNKPQEVAKVQKLPTMVFEGTTKDTKPEPKLNSAVGVFDATVKTPAALVWGAVSWPFAQAAKFGTIYGQKIQQNIRYAPEGSTEPPKSIVPKMTDEEITELGNQTAEWFSSLGGNLSPKSKAGKSAMGIAQSAVEPLASAAHWINSGIDEKKYPHMKQLADTVTEGMFFGFLGKFGKKAVEVGKKQLKVREAEKAGKAKEAEVARVEAEKAETALMETAEKAAKKNEFDSWVEEYRTAIEKVAKADREAVVPLKQTERSILQEGREIAERGFDENLSRPPIERPLTLNQRANIERGRDGIFKEKKVGELPAEVTPERLERIDLGKEPVSGLPKMVFDKSVTSKKNKVKSVTEELKQKVPEVEFKRDKDFGDMAQFTPIGSEFNGRTFVVKGEVTAKSVLDKFKEVTGWDGKSPLGPTPSKKVKLSVAEANKLALEKAKAKAKGVTLSAGLDPMQGLKAVTQTVRDIIRPGKKALKDSISPERVKQLKGLGEMAKKSGLEFGQYVQGLGLKPEEVKRLTELYGKTKLESAGIEIKPVVPEATFKSKKGTEYEKVAGEWYTKSGVKVNSKWKLKAIEAGAKSTGKVGTGKIESGTGAPHQFDPFNRPKGDPKVNVTKGSNEKIEIGLSDVQTMAQIPVMKRGGLVKGLKVPETFFAENKAIRPLMDWKRQLDKAVVTEKEALTKKFRSIEKKWRKKKLRKEAGAWYMTKGKFGKEAMDKMGVKVKENPKYKAMIEEIQPVFKDLLVQINDARVKVGKKKIKEMDDFLAFFAEESFMRDVRDLIHGEGNPHKMSLVMDDLATINARHTKTVLDQANFNHVTRQGLRDGVNLELDPLIILKRYATEALPAVHYSPLNAYLKEVLTKDLKLPNGEVINFKDVNPGLAAELGGWSNNLIGKSNLPLPPFLEKQLGKLSRNLTNATLVGNIRTASIQPTALLTTFTELPVETGKATIDFLKDFSKKKKGSSVEKSDVLVNPSVDVAFGGKGDAVGGTMLEKAGAATANTMSWAMRQADYVAREITFRAKMLELKKAVKSGKLTEAEAVKQADSMVVRTQSSGAPGEVSPIQRSALGKMLTLWQTFTIGHVNWLAREVVGIKNPELTPKKTAARTFRYLLGMVTLGYVFEDVFGIQAPGPAPIQSIKRELKEQAELIKKGKQDGYDLFKTALTTGRELTELIPFGASVKFGSNPLGPVVEFLGSVSDIAGGTDFFSKDVLTKAKNGDVKSIVKVLEIAGKMRGVPGTAQIAKTARGLLRDEPVMRALIGRIYGETGAPPGGYKKEKNFLRKATRKNSRKNSRKVTR